MTAMIQRDGAITKERQLLIIALAVLVAAAGCARVSTPQACEEAAELAESAAQSGGQISDEAWRADLQCLAAAMVEKHPDLFYSITEQEFEAAVDRLYAEIPSLTDYEIILEMSKLVAIVSQEGRDGHTHLHKVGGSLPFTQSLYPIRLYGFEDGVFIIDALEPHQDLVGARVEAVDGIRVEDIHEWLNPAISRDNDMAIEARIYLLYPFAEILHAAGITASAREAEWTLSRSGGQDFSVLLSPIEGSDYWAWAATASPLLPSQPPPETELPLYLRNLGERFWFTYLDDSRTLYIQYNEVQRENHAGETMAEFSERIEEYVGRYEVERVVVDLRHNHGGDNTTYGPFMDVLQSDRINQPGKLFIIVGRGTFSAAGNFATEVERQTHALFVGEPMGTSPNQYGDAEPVSLPNSGIVVSVSTRYHQFSQADDPRLTIIPDIPSPLSSADYFANRDPAMEAILAYEKPSSDP